MDPDKHTDLEAAKALLAYDEVELRFAFIQFLQARDELLEFYKTLRNNSED